MKVGIYFKLPNGYIVDAVPVEAGEAYGEATGHGGHYDFHELFTPTTPSERSFKAHDYGFYPRGRVVFFPSHNTFILYADPCFTPEDISQVKKIFELYGQRVEVADDQHYRCSGCSGFYME